MLFNSYIFLFFFLPATLLIFRLARRIAGFRAGMGILVVASLAFYGWWNPKYLLLLAGLIIVNFFLARLLIRIRERSLTLAKWVLGIGIAGNLAALCYYKYANFFIDNLNDFFHLHVEIAAVLLPIGISFFTFQKIAFLVDIYRQRVGKIPLLDFALFVTFFPQLLAGPITHHSEIFPQFTPDRMRATVDSLQIGLVFFVIGLAKKVLLADHVATYVGPLFGAAAGGAHLDFIAAWGAALAYAAQIYFDFSAYSDMAIGLGMFFGIRLPLNFDSPYKSASIIEFWRRWHMTLSRFLRDYLYIGLLGGNRKGAFRRYVNLLATMVLGGIWHGAGWTYLVWGGLHGTCLALNHAWRALWPVTDAPRQAGLLRRASGRTATFLIVVAGWVFFRAADLATACDLLKAMCGRYGLAVPHSWAAFAPRLQISAAPVDGGMALLTALALLAVSWFAPNAQELTAYVGPESSSRIYAAGRETAGRKWKPSWAWALALGVLLAVSLMRLSNVTEFIYYQF